MKAEPCQRRFAATRRVPRGVLVLYAALHALLAHLCFHEALAGPVSLRVFVATSGLVTYTLLTYLVKLALLGGGLLLLVGRLRLRDLGLAPAHLLDGVLITALLWGLVQLSVSLIGQLGGTPLQPNPALLSPLPTVLLGQLLENTLGSALVEETLYRGFLLPQLYLLAGTWWPARPARRLAFALSVSQLFFGLNHLPAGLAMDLPAAALVAYMASMTLGGLFFAALFLTTGNLFLAVGVHALLNFPAALFTSAVDPSLLVLVFAVALLLLWPRLMCPPSRVPASRPALMTGWHPARSTGRMWRTHLW